MTTATRTTSLAVPASVLNFNVHTEAKRHRVREPGAGESNLQVRGATERDAGTISQLFRTVYGESSHPCKDAEFVRATFKTGNDLWFVGISGGRIVACTAQVRQPWNGTFEGCRSVTLPECRGSGLGSILYSHGLELASQRQDFAFGFGYPRTLAMFRLQSRSSALPFVILGHDGAMNIANGKREYHLVGMTGNQRQPITRVVPAGNRIATSKFVQEHIVAPLAIRSEVGACPTACVVGPARGQHIVIRGVTLEYRFQEDMPNKALEIVAMDAGRATAEQAAHALGELLAKFPSALHVSATVLVDKIRLMKAMRTMGFEATAYLPAHYSLAQRRYDCVMLVKSSYTEEPVTHETAELIQAFREGLSAQFNV